ncbi:MAG: helix-turn-helix transcriptional regulator [Lachnospiraceae bacterium]|nr:helix-turn-helix transcriptional regulator [Lachnospiraceae bacterium]
MGLQNEVKDYLSQYGISKSHMAKTLGISIQQLSAWTNGKLVLPDYHMKMIGQYVDTLKRVDDFLQINGLVL